jgi:hypothetical protein
MATLLIELHAFNRHYLQPDRMPFLYAWAERRGLSELMPPFGYDALTSLWTGTWPEQHGHFAKYAYHSKRRLSPSDRLPGNFLATAWFNLKRWRRGDDFLTRLAPDPRSRYFQVERRFHYPHPGSFAVPTWFDELRAAQRTFLFFEWPLIAQANRPNRHTLRGGDDTGRVSHFRRLRHQYPDLDFYFLMLKDLDTVGHRYGPFSPEVTALCQRLDGLLRDALADFSAERDNLLIMSSYGMLPVTGRVNVGAIIPPFGEGYVYFLDSTMARFWFHDDCVRQTVLETLTHADFGRIIGDDELRRQHAFFPDRRFGEVLFMVNPGLVISPDFYRGAPARGMHTYDLSNSGGHEFGVVLANRPLEPSLRAIDLLPTMASLMNISIQSDVAGRSGLR